MPKLFCILMLWTACAVAQTVEGNVVNSATGNGIAGVKVEIVQAGHTVYSAITDAQGRFQIREVKDGAYTARYSSLDYWHEPTAPWREPEAPRPFQVMTGGNPVKLEARMIPLGRITGRVIDGRGEPVPDARLELTQSGTLVQPSATDANGRFEVHRQVLFPGAYTLAVVPPLGWKPPDPEPGSDRVRGWARTYYPGVAIPEAASKIVLQPGGELLDIQIKLLAVPAHAVRGALLNRDGTPAPKVAIALGEDARMPILRVESKPDGTFEFPAVVDGRWRVSAEMESGGVRLRVAQWMEMAGRELERVKLQLNAPFMIRGKVLMETPKGLAAPKPPAVRLYSVNRGRGTLQEIYQIARAEADGTFSVENVYPGAYRLGAPAPPAYYLDAVRLGEAELATPEVELISGAALITLVYKTNGGTVRGTVEKCASGWVVLVPQDATMRWPGFVHRVRCDSNDRYEISAVRPGEYHALALAADRSSPFWVPKFDDGYLNQTRRITVRAGEASSVDLRAITEPPY